ncbi:MAG: hypothetical protein K6G25_00595 [Bacteroidales bacterium]|nr:hypothetical protein [Bacteroidales bacterium]
MKLRLFIVLFAFCALFSGCHKPDLEPSALPVSPLHDTLASIDSLMWHQPDSAFAVLQRFAESLKMDSLDTFDRNYCQLLMSELLYQNENEQSNRAELLKAVGYFDSLANTRSMNLQQNAFLVARAHYTDGIGYTEQDSLIAACREYLCALETIETHFSSDEIASQVPTPHVPRLLSQAYSRLSKLFSDQYMREPSAVCCKRALVFDSVAPGGPFDRSKLLLRLGLQYNVLAQFDSARYCFDEALRQLPDTNNIVYRNIMAEKALLYYSMEQVDLALNCLKRLAPQEERESERVTDHLFIGSIYYAEDQFDSALVYLVPVYENTEDANQKRGTAQFLRDIYQRRGDTLTANQYVLPPTEEDVVGEVKTKTDVSRLSNMFQNFLNWERDRAKTERQETARLRRNKLIALSCTILVLAALAAWLLHKRKMKQQRNAASQKMEAERQAHQLQQSALSGRLKRSNQELRELKDQMQHQANNTLAEQETQVASFHDEPICRLIMERVNEGQFKSKVNYLSYQEYALSREQVTNLREAADRHFGQFTVRLAKAYPDLTKSDLDYCCLYLLDLNDADIAALMQRTYTTVSERSRKLKALFGSEEPLSTILRGMNAEDLFS